MKIHKSSNSTIVVKRTEIEKRKLVYIGCANKQISYGKQKSCIVYIGKTHNGIKRIASSAAFRAPLIFDKHGITHVDFYVVTHKPIHKIDIVSKLEGALLEVFRREYDNHFPVANTISGAKLDKRYFTHEQRLEIIDHYNNL